ncbi:unnamed protein product [Larinioides sclopetarius]|uniref:Uncharacterized protein n=1 Tax=Larinioides sclopetarius TaxID=280406 RepID=A0AAV1ZNB1_9ARAC
MLKICLYVLIKISIPSSHTKYLGLSDAHIVKYRFHHRKMNEFKLTKSFNTNIYFLFFLSE